MQHNSRNRRRHKSFRVFSIMAKFSFAYLLLVIASYFAAADVDEQTARLLLYKSVVTDPVVEGQEFVISYQIINTGEATASNIEIFDKYDTVSFNGTNNVNGDGDVKFELETLVPGAKAQFFAHVVPKLYGVYDSQRARMKYVNSEVQYDDVEPEFRNAYSTSLGKVRILSTAEFIRATSYNVQEWSLFFILSALATVVPYVLWKTNQNKALELSVSHTKKE